VSTPFVREVCGDAVYLVEPEVEALARAITLVGQDNALARRLSDAGLSRAEQYSWERVAHGVMSAYLLAATMEAAQRPPGTR